VIVLLPTANPFAVTGATLMVARPPLKAIEPTVTLPTLNVTVPVGCVPLVVVTVAVTLCGTEELPRAIEDGLTVTSVIVLSIIVNIDALLVEPASLLSPPYTAVIEFKPTAKPLAVVVAKVSDAVPLESEPVPSAVLPSLNVTKPVAIAELTVAVRVADAPRVNEFATDIFVVVSSLLTVSDTSAVAVV
jgi:hypothetical protein